MHRLRHRRPTSGPRARSGPRRPSVRPATLLGNNIAIRPAKPFRCWCATVRPPDTPSPYTRCTASFTKRLCAPSLPTSLTLVIDMHAHITAFEVKLRFWEAQLANGQLEHFPRLAQVTACVLLCACLAAHTVVNSSSPKWSTQSLAFAPCSRTVISMTFFCCWGHPSSRTLTYFFMASSTSRRTDVPALQ